MIIDNRHQITIETRKQYPFTESTNSDDRINIRDTVTYWMLIKIATIIRKG